MAKIKKKGTSGAAKNFTTRSSAIRKLQISLPDFRRLCIYKGIYPREPRNKKKAAKSSTPSTTFYYTKDIQYLLHEPLLAKLRDRYALLKKIQRALGRGEAGDASRLERTHMPKMRLDHIVKERYPTFIDALRDLDDCLSMLFLFANLPSSDHVPAKTIALCKRLCLEFEHYIIVSHALRRSFLSIKGIYYGAEIQGQDILWLAPYKFVQQVTGDVDFRIMATFVEFYTCLLSFVNYRLYTSIGLVYPPKFNALTDEQGGELGAFSLEGLNTDANIPSLQAITNGTSQEKPVDEQATAKAQAAVKSLSAISEPAEPEQPVATTTQEIDQFTSTDPAADILAQPSLQSSASGTLFKDFSFYLSRETPRAPLEFLLRAFGCRHIGWDELSGGAGAWTNDELDARITHQVVDRPPVAPSDDDTQASQRGGRVAGRTYIQPQWIWDCVNAGKLLRPDLYAPGATLPPHLSPWMKDRQRAGEYDPTAPLEDLMENGTHVNGENDDKDESVVDGVDSVKALGDLNGAGESEEEDDDDDDEDMEEDDSEDEEEEESTGNFDGLSEDEGAADMQHQRELEAEAAGLPAPKPKPKSKSATPQARAAREEQEQRERQVMMLSRRQAKLYGRMQHGKDQQSAEREKLQGRKRALAEAAAGKKKKAENPKRRRMNKA